MLINIIMYIIALSKSSKIAMSVMLYKYFAKIQLISYYNKYYIISLLILLPNLFSKFYNQTTFSIKSFLNQEPIYSKQYLQTMSALKK